jgi:ABC-2 type transport system ATP-binding protein
MSVINARGLKKQYKDVHALDGFDLTVEPGQIVGLIGPNGSGKTTAINSMLGLNNLDSGELEVLGKSPHSQRAELMQEVAYIADTGILPHWMRVADLLDYVENVHPRFSREVALSHLSKTEINQRKKVSVLSKGMHVQLHLALILAIDAPLLVLDEPTLGLDILYRQQFYDGILNDFFNEGRSILVTTHEVREIEHILTDVVFIHHGRARLKIAMDELPQRYAKLTTQAEVKLPAEPLVSRRSLNGTEHIFEGVDRDLLQKIGEVNTPNLAELFVAIVGDKKVGDNK